MRPFIPGGVAAAAALALWSAVAGAVPSDNNSYELHGTCGGESVVMVDPQGPNPVAFESESGRVGVGHEFFGINLDTGEIVFHEVYGHGVDKSELVQCDFPSDETLPDGTIVHGLLRVLVRFPGEGR